MSLTSKLLLTVTLSIVVSVGAVAWLIEARTRESFRQVDQDRTTALVSQFHREFDREGDDVAQGVEAIINSESMLQITLQLSSGFDPATFVNAAKDYAAARHFDFLDMLGPDGSIISSYPVSARFGYKERWVMEQSASVPQQAFLRHVQTLQENAPGILCVRSLKTHGLNFYVVGGRKLDTALLQSLAIPAGMRAFIFSSDEQGQGKLLGFNSENLDSSKLTPLAQQALEQRKDASATVHWDNGDEELFHAVILPGYTDRAAAVLLIGNSLQQQRTLEAHIQKVSLLIALFGALFGVIVSTVIATRIVHPVRDLADAAAKIGSGDWSVYVEPSSSDEIGQLAQAFNQMTRELVGQRERLVQSERVAAWRELARRLAHELKNPLFPLQITVENLLRAREASPEQFEEVFRESTSTLLAEIANLKTIISRFSDFSKMPAPQVQAVDFNDLVLSVVQLFQGQLMREPARITSDLQLGNVPLVSGDPVLLRRVIENLVLNAVDAMPKGGRLIFRTGRADKYVFFELSDSGVGLTPEECERLFTPYYTSKQHGTGLGLAIVQSVISDHHGRITVSSKKDAGTTFHVELPVFEAGMKEAANDAN